MSESKHILELDKHEQGVLVRSLNDSRNELIKDNQPTDVVDDMLLKVIDAPKRKKRWFHAER